MAIFERDDRRKKIEEALRSISSAMENISVIVEFPHLLREVDYSDSPLREDTTRGGVFGGNDTGDRVLALRIVYADDPELSKISKDRLKSIEEELTAELERIKKEQVQLNGRK